MLTSWQLDIKFAQLAAERASKNAELSPTGAHAAAEGALADRHHECSSLCYHGDKYPPDGDEDQDDERKRVQHLADPVDGYQATPDVGKDWQYDQDSDGTTVDDPDGGEAGETTQLRYATSRLGHPSNPGPAEAVDSPVGVPVPEGVFRPSDIRRELVTDGQAARDACSAVGKAFRDAVPGPDSYPAPARMVPSERPFISQGHAAPSPAFDGPRTADKPTEPMSVTPATRGPLTDGHARPSPSNK